MHGSLAPSIRLLEDDLLVSVGSAGHVLGALSQIGFEGEAWINANWSFLEVFYSA